MRKTILLIVLALLSFAGFASAQVYERPTEIIFDMAQLRYRPGLVQISPNYTTTLVFDDIVQRSVTSDDSLIQALVKDNIIFLRAKKPAGQTDLVVNVGNQTLMFQLVVETDTFLPRKYTIRFPLRHDVYYGVPATKRTASLPPPPLPSRQTDATSTSAGQKPVNNPEPETSTTTVTQEQASTTTYDKAGEPIAPPGNNSQDSSKPASVSSPDNEPLAGTRNEIEFDTNATRTSEGTIAVTYKITNKSDEPIVLDTARLEVVDPSTNSPLDYQLVRLSVGTIAGRLSPGESEEAMIVINNPTLSAVEIRWPVIWLGSQRKQTLEKYVSIQ